MLGFRGTKLVPSIAILAVLVGTVLVPSATVGGFSPPRAGVASFASHWVVAAPHSAAATPRAAAAHAGAHPLANPTFPRTVLVETFTGVWCIHCPAESQALFQMDLHTSHNVLAISELHVCAFPPGSGPCLENYVPPDGTSDARGVFYSVCGYPDVFIDGNQGVCGATNSESQMYGWYQNAIANASAYPGNVSITQDAKVSYTNVTVSESITSGLTGTYNAITYLLEYIGKRNQSNGYGPHDVGYVVRATLHNGPVALVAGASSDLNFRGAILPGWNALNLSVVSFVQNNASRVVENTNFAQAPTLLTSLSADRLNLSSRAVTNLTVQVTNSSTGLPLAGATINLTSSIGGVLNPAGGVTSSSGTFSATFTAPTVSSIEDAVVTANVTAAGYSTGQAVATIQVNPLVPPSVARAVAITPGVGQVTLNWTAPLSGGGGVTYQVYWAAVKTGPFTLLGTTTSTTFNASGLIAGQTVWFEIGAKDSGGAAPNSTALSATSVSATPIDLPGSDGFWVAFGSLNFTSSADTALVLFLPTGDYTFTYGASTYAIIPKQASVGPVHVAAVPLVVNLTFLPRVGTLEGTVSPASANLTVNGTAVQTLAGAFSYQAPAGTYVVVASLSGYVTNTTTVTLTPGNLTPLNINLQSVPSSGSQTSGMLSGDALVEIGLLAVIVGAVGILGVVMWRFSPKRRTPSGPARRPSPPPESED